MSNYDFIDDEVIDDDNGIELIIDECAKKTIEEVDDEKYDFDCPVCNLKAKPLLIAICGHSICEECSKHLNPLNCPICRAPYQKP